MGRDNISQLPVPGDAVIFRIDDVSINTDPDRLRRIIAIIRRNVPGADVMLAVSLLVHRMPDEMLTRERTFPRELNAFSDHRVFFHVHKCGRPELNIFDGRVASHGLVHVDHRLLGREAQEMSILMSCSILGTTVFVPPFNKWNKDTESICNEHNLELVRFEDGWKHIGYNRFDPKHQQWYLHTHDVDTDVLLHWFSEQ
jgi:hypothetical protein